MWETFEARNNGQPYATADGRIQAQGQCGTELAAEKMIQQWKRSTPSFGKWMMDNSISNNTEFAAVDSFGFYAGSENDNGDTIVLQAGPKGW